MMAADAPRSTTPTSTPLIRYLYTGIDWVEFDPEGHPFTVGDIDVEVHPRGWAARIPERKPSNLGGAGVIHSRHIGSRTR